MTMTSRLIAATLLATGALSACGESDQEKAQTKVCDARADIQSQIDTLKGLPVSPDSVDKATASLQAMRGSLNEIADAQPDLDPDRKQEVEAAVKTFGDQVRTAAAAAVSSGATGDAAASVRTAANQLATSFRESFQPIDCS
jgi:hypothetical protein